MNREVRTPLGQTHPRLMCSELGGAAWGQRRQGRVICRYQKARAPLLQALIPKCLEVNYEARPLFIGVNADKSPSRRIAIIDGFC